MSPRTFSDYRLLVENALESYSFSGPPLLTEAMRYALLGGGKRIRGVLSLAFCEAAGSAGEEALPSAVAIEMIHAYSLVHDDLPAMDNDTMRRGKKTCHIAYGEARAILAGDALLTEAFRCLSRVPSPLSTRLIALFAQNAGSDGMVGGQELDLYSSPSSQEDLMNLDHKKTGALIVTACVSGILHANGNEEQMRYAAEYGKHLGIAFQMQDDYLDAKGNPELLGKSTGKDASSGKVTYYSLLGEDELRHKIREETQLAVKSCEHFSACTMLRDLACSMAERQY